MNNISSVLFSYKAKGIAAMQTKVGQNKII